MCFADLWGLYNDPPIIGIYIERYRAGKAQIQQRYITELIIKWLSLCKAALISITINNNYNRRL